MRVVSRDEAIDRLTAERGAVDVSCLICALRDGSTGPTYELARSAHATVLLPRYALRRGHILVIANDHVTSFTDLSLSTWEEMNRLAFHAARVLEHSLRPLRCYVASLGAPAPDLLMTSPHVHLHVVPIHSAEDKPSTVLSWGRGVLIGEEEEWIELRRELTAAW
jgi:diadenosine tetraphosphate (Ap4A) HIT family hydrolase